MKKETVIRPILLTMSVGDVKAWPIERVNSLRASINVCGLERNLKFRTKSDRKKGIISVTRVQ